MPRTMLSHQQWALIEPVLPGKRRDPGRTAFNNRASLEGILWIMRTGSPWRDVPEAFGNWNTIYRRFRRWTQYGIFDRIFDATKGKLDLRTVMVDGTYVKVHQHAAGAPKELARPRIPPNSKLLDLPEAGVLPN